MTFGKSILQIYLIRSAMDTILKFSFWANCRSFGNLAIEPSSSTISHKTPAGSNPARMARSTAASVWPALFRMPPSLYFNGNMCPGRLKSSGFESFDARAFIVLVRSRAETPVLVPCFASYNNAINMCLDKNHSLNFPIVTKNQIYPKYYLRLLKNCIPRI